MEDDETEEEGGGGGGSAKQRFSLPSLPLLQTWYQDMHRKDSIGTRPPVVIIVEDFEAFPSRILEDLIMSLSPHLATLPVVLILGVATSAAAIHSLPRSSSSLLCLEQFATPFSADTLTLLIEKILLSPELPFHLDYNALQFLLHQFLCSSLSVSQFSLTLQVSMLEHFHWQPLSFLIGQWDDPDSLVAALDQTQCEMLRATPSFRKYVENLDDPKEQIKLLTRDQHLKAVAKEYLHRLRLHQHTFPPLLLCLHTLTENLPTTPIGKNLHDVYLLCMEKNISENSKFITAWNLLKMMGREDLTTSVEKCIAILRTASADLGSALSKFTKIFKHFLRDLEKIDSEDRQSKDEAEGDGGYVRGELQTTSERKMILQERLRQVANRKRDPTAYDKAKLTFLDQLHSVLQEYLIPPSCLPLHEICYFNDASTLRKHLSPAPRASLHIALTRPTFYLPSARSGSEHSRLSPNMPDVCILYQLHLECGRLINLFDWLCSFVAVVDPQAAEKLTNQEGGKSRKEDIDSSLQARFIQAVSELQLLGFVKPTQRKTDHVQRLTWGAC